MKNHTFLTQRLPADIGRALEAAAAASNLSVAGFVRAAIVRSLPEGVPLTPPRPSPPRRPKITPPEDIAALSVFGGHLGRLTGSMVRLAKACRESGRLLEHEALETEICDLRAAKAEIVGIVNRQCAAEAAAAS